jgi:hypothetical protein
MFAGILGDKMKSFDSKFRNFVRLMYWENRKERFCWRQECISEQEYWSRNKFFLKRLYKSNERI